MQDYNARGARGDRAHGNQRRPRSTSPRAVRPLPRRRRWDQMSWWYSLITVIPIVLILADWLLNFSPVHWFTRDRPASAELRLTVLDADLGQPLQGAVVRAGSASAETDATGVVAFRLSTLPVMVTVAHPDYEPAYGEFDASFDPHQTVTLRRVTSGSNLHAMVSSTPAGDSSASPAERNEHAAESAPAAGGEQNASSDGIVTGVVTDQNGNPVRDALVLAGGTRARTTRSGTFRLHGAEAASDLTVVAPGYAKAQMPLAGEREVRIQLVPQEIRAIYLSGQNAGNADVVQRLIDLIDQTELNAIVIDIKEGYVWYDTSVQFFHDASAVLPTYDPRPLIQELHDRGIYVIARQVVFNDPIVAENRPDLAIKTEDGGVWRGWMGDAWVNPFNRELWQPNIDLAVEAAELGFDEIQYDYIRFPSDGDLTVADFGPNYTEDGRVAAIVEFLKESRKALEPTGAMLAVDIFGIVAVYGDDQGIGQRLVDIAPVVDYVCPMIYPSHFNATSIDVGGEPNDYPYETITLSLALAKQKMPGMERKLRPWLQDFDQPPFRDYTPDDVRAQIRASEEQGTSGWMLWNAANVYTEEALNAS